MKFSTFVQFLSGDSLSVPILGVEIEMGFGQRWFGSRVLRSQNNSVKKKELELDKQFETWKTILCFTGKQTGHDCPVQFRQSILQTTYSDGSRHSNEVRIKKVILLALAKHEQAVRGGDDLLTALVHDDAHARRPCT